MQRKHQYTLIAVVISIFAIIVYGTVDVDANPGITIKQIGNDSKGIVTKITYHNSTNATAKIAVVSGMHPREVLARDTVPKVVKSFAQEHDDVEVVNYKVNVTAYPENFYTGRDNGEYLVAKYIIPDIAKSNYDVVIIAHDHEDGYGEGYYFATPTMDTESMEIAQAARYILTDFNFCTRDVTKKADSNSIESVDEPIVATGTPLMVYEAPEWVGEADVIKNTSRYFETVLKVLNSQKN